MLINCFVCGEQVHKSPSKVYKRPCCSRKCQVTLAKVEIINIGLKTRITPKRSKELRKIATERLKELTTGEQHYAWKGQEVSYRGLHYWVRRKLGKPTKCTFCGKQNERPRQIQWANIDGKYRRNLEDFISLCVSCHKNHDLSLGRLSTQDAPSANQ